MTSIFFVLWKIFSVTKRFFKQIRWKRMRNISWAQNLPYFTWEEPTWYMVPSISFQTFFVQAFKIVVNSWKSSMLLLYILRDNWSIFMISGLNKQLQQQLEYTLLNPDCHSWWISKMQSGRQDTLEEPYAIKLCFKLGKNATETYGMHFDHLAWIEHQFWSGIRDSRKAGSLWEMMRGVGGVKKSIHKSWLAKGLGLNYYVEVLREFRQRFRRKRPALFKSGQ